MAAEEVVEIETYTDKNDQLVDILHNQVKDNTCLRISDQRFSADRRETPAYSKLLAISNVYGYIVAGTPKGLSVFMSKDAREELLKGTSKGTNTAVALTARKEIDLAQHGRITHVGVSADEQSVLVATVRGNILVFSAASLVSQGSSTPTKTINVGKEIRDMCPNPKDLPTTAAVVTVAGDLIVIDMVSGTVTTIVASSSVRVLCVCWSPKGKQLVCGDSSGTLTQRTPNDGTIKRTVTVQTDDNRVPDRAAVLAVHWIDQHTYFAVYGQLPENAFATGCGGGGSASDDDEFEDNATAAYVITRADKKSPLEWIYIEDPCSAMMCPGRYPGFHFASISDWGPSAQNILIMSGAGSDATLTIGEAATDTTDDGVADPLSLDWAQWDIDGSMAVMPLSALATDEDSSDTFPLGLAIDFTGHQDLPPVVDDGGRVKPVPILWILNTDACLLAYHVSNMYEMSRGGRSKLMVDAVKQLPGASPKTSFAAGTAFGSGFGAKTAETPKAGAFGSASSATPSFGSASSTSFGASSSGFGKSTITPIVKAPAGFGAAKQGFGSGTKFGSTAGASFGSLTGATGAAGKSVFDAPASGPSIFDAPAKQGAFGASKPASSGFGGTSAFGSKSETKPAFGAKSETTSGFGASKPTSSGFGGSSAFGAKSETTSVFGAANSSSASTTSTPAVSKPEGFASLTGSAWGTSKAEAKPITTAFPSMSAQTSTPSSGFGGFGTTKTEPKASAGGFGGFGAAKTEPKISASGFGGFGASKTEPKAAPDVDELGSAKTEPKASASGFGGFGTAKTEPRATRKDLDGFGVAKDQSKVNVSVFGAKPTSTPSGLGGFGGFGAALTETPTKNVDAERKEQERQEQERQELKQKTQDMVDAQYVATCNQFDGELKAFAQAIQKSEAAIARMRAAQLPPIAVDATVQNMAALTSNMQAMSIDDTELWNRTADVLLEALQMSCTELRSSQRSLSQQHSGFVKTETKREEITRILSQAESSAMSTPQGLNPLQRDYQRRLKRAFGVISKRAVDVEQVVHAEADRLESERADERSLRAPTLDSIQRTLLNVDKTLGQKNHELDELTAMVDAMGLGAPLASQHRAKPRPMPLSLLETPALASASTASNHPRTAAEGVPWSPANLPLSTPSPFGRRNGGFGLRDEDLLVSGRAPAHSVQHASISPLQDRGTGTHESPRFPYTQVRELVPRSTKPHRRTSLVEDDVRGCDTASVAPSVYSTAASHLRTRRQRAVVREALTRPSRVASVIRSPVSSVARARDAAEGSIVSELVPMPNLDRYVQAFGKLKIEVPKIEEPKPEEPKPEEVKPEEVKPEDPVAEEPKPKAQPESKWECAVCEITNPDSALQCMACETAKPGSQPETPVALSLGGFKLSSGLSLGSALSSAMPKTTTSFGFSGFSKTPSASFKPFVPPGAAPAASSTTPATTSTAAASGAQWTCDVCDLKSPDTATECQVCEAPRPGAPAKPTVPAFGSSGFQPSSSKPLSSFVPSTQSTFSLTGAKPSFSAFVPPGSTAPAAVSITTEPLDKGLEWTCEVCELRSPGSALKCTICEADKPSGARLMEKVTTFAKMQESGGETESDNGSSVFSGSEIEESDDGLSEVEETDDEQPEVEESDDDQPEVEESAGEQSKVEETADDQPEIKETADELPKVEEAADEQPEVEDIADEQSSVKETADVQSEAAESVVVQPEVEENTDNEPKVEESAEEQPEVQESANDQPKVEVNADDQSEIKETADEQPEVEESSDEQPEVKEIAEEQPNVKDSADVQPEVEENADEQPDVTESAVVQPEVEESIDEQPEVKETADELPDTFANTLKKAIIEHADDSSAEPEVDEKQECDSAQPKVAVETDKERDTESDTGPILADEEELESDHVDTVSVATSIMDDDRSDRSVSERAEHSDHDSDSFVHISQQVSGLDDVVPLDDDGYPVEDSQETQLDVTTSPKFDIGELQSLFTGASVESVVEHALAVASEAAAILPEETSAPSTPTPVVPVTVPDEGSPAGSSAGDYVMLSHPENSADTSPPEPAEASDIDEDVDDDYGKEEDVDTEFNMDSISAGIDSALPESPVEDAQLVGGSEPSDMGSDDELGSVDGMESDTSTKPEPAKPSTGGNDAKSFFKAGKLGGFSSFSQKSSFGSIGGSAFGGAQSGTTSLPNAFSEPAQSAIPAFGSKLDKPVFGVASMSGFGNASKPTMGTLGSASTSSFASMSMSSGFGAHANTRGSFAALRDKGSSPDSDSPSIFGESKTSGSPMFGQSVSGSGIGRGFGSIKSKATGDKPGAESDPLLRVIQGDDSDAGGSASDSD
ncbi:hypothetical protein GGH12_005904 [Coemansia sp. RSA 1822]|nr:hypothetical protein LPJ76_005677 [Coemansia sp. RSA 638]KAJ2543584.1 hypothetical protein GGF49_001982 [Coemansia sp. RSA 1853]KAJ2558330.1 hypothetical protein GGH12_005904 [Coemansia sp. RSA 1822]